MGRVSKRPYIMMGDGANSWGTWGSKKSSGGGAGDLDPASMVGTKIRPATFGRGDVASDFELLSVVRDGIYQIRNWRHTIRFISLLSEVADGDTALVYFNWHQALKPYGGGGLHLLPFSSSTPNFPVFTKDGGVNAGYELKLRKYNMTSFRSGSRPVLYGGMGEAYDYRFYADTGAGATFPGTYIRDFSNTTIGS